MDMKYRRSVMLNTMSLITNACTLLEVQRDHAGHGGGGGGNFKGLCPKSQPLFAHFSDDNYKFSFRPSLSSPLLLVDIFLPPTPKKSLWF